MTYLVCPTCGWFIGQKSIEYEKKVSLINSNKDLNQDEKEIEISKVLSDLKLKRYCCKMRLMTSKDYIEIF